MTGLLFLFAAFASEPVAVSHIDDVNRLLREGAPAVDLAAAIGASDYAFLPRHAYALLDGHAPADVVRAVSAKAGVYWDATLEPLDQVAAKARLGAASETMNVDADGVVVIERLADAFHAREAVVARVGPAPTRLANETDYAFDQRGRTYKLSLAKALGPVEGRLEGLRFVLTVPAFYGEPDGAGCLTVRANVDVSIVDFFVFRNAMGTTLQRNAVELGKVSKTVASLVWIGDDKERFEAASIPLCGPAVPGLVGKTARLEATIRRKASGGWTADAAEFVDSRTGSRVKATF